MLLHGLRQNRFTNNEEERSKRKAVSEDRLMLLSPRESQVVELMGRGLE